MFARIENNRVVKYPVDLRLDYPKVSWPGNLDNVADAGLPEGIVRVEQTPKPTEPYIEVTKSDVVNRNGKWILAWSIRRWSAAEIAASLKEQVTEKRWLVETSGITMDSGLKVLTAISDQNRISNILAGGDRPNIKTVGFKFGGGVWKDITFAQLSKLYSFIVDTHSRNAFANERAHHEQIDILLRSPNPSRNLLSYDITTGWIDHYPTFKL